MNQQPEGTSVHDSKKEEEGKEKRKKKKGRRGGGGGLSCGGWGLSKGEVWPVDGANAQDPQGWKRSWELWGVGLRLQEQKGPRRAPHPWSQRLGSLTWELSRLPSPSGPGDRPLLLSGSSPRVPPTCLS